MDNATLENTTMKTGPRNSDDLVDQALLSLLDKSNSTDALFAMAELRFWRDARALGKAQVGLKHYEQHETGE